MCDNGEAYEDYSTWRDKVYFSRKSAETRIYRLNLQFKQDYTSDVDWCLQTAWLDEVGVLP